MSNQTTTQNTPETESGQGERRDAQVIFRTNGDRREQAHQATAGMGEYLSEVLEGAMSALIRAPRLTRRVLRYIRRTNGDRGQGLERALDRIESGGKRTNGGR